MRSTRAATPSQVPTSARLEPQALRTCAAPRRTTARLRSTPAPKRVRQIGDCKLRAIPRIVVFGKNLTSSASIEARRPASSAERGLPASASTPWPSTSLPSEGTSSRWRITSRTGSAPSSRSARERPIQSVAQLSGSVRSGVRALARRNRSPTIGDYARATDQMRARAPAQIPTHSAPGSHWRLSAPACVSPPLVT